MVAPAATRNGNLLSNFKQGVTLLVIGPSGTGKSTLLGSSGALSERVKLLVTKASEANSFMYERHGLEPEYFVDHKWRPSAGSYEADGFQRLMRRLLELYDDTETDIVLIDPLTDAALLASHDLLKAEKAETPRDLRDPLGYYGSLRYKLKDLVQLAVGLASADLPKPKHVLCTVHAQPTKEEDIKGKATSEGQAKGVEFFGDVLPMLEGSYRREIASEFDIVGYSTVKHEMSQNPQTKKFERQTRYLVQVAPDNERHAKVRLAPALAERELENSFEAILEAVLKARKT